MPSLVAFSILVVLFPFPSTPAPRDIIKNAYMERLEHILNEQLRTSGKLDMKRAAQLAYDDDSFILEGVREEDEGAVDPPSTLAPPVTRAKTPGAPASKPTKSSSSVTSSPPGYEPQPPSYDEKSLSPLSKMYEESLDVAVNGTTPSIGYDGDSAAVEMPTSATSVVTPSTTTALPFSPSDDIYGGKATEEETATDGDTEWTMDVRDDLQREENEAITLPPVTEETSHPETATLPSSTPTMEDVGYEVAVEGDDKEMDNDSYGMAGDDQDIVNDVFSSFREAGDMATSTALPTEEAVEEATEMTTPSYDEEEEDTTGYHGETVAYVDTTEMPMESMTVSDEGVDENRVEESGYEFSADEAVVKAPANESVIHTGYDLETEAVEGKIEEMEKNETKAVKGGTDACASPAPCAENCFVWMNGEGCQTCLCMWQSSPCDTDSECPLDSNQHCEDGRCQCMKGYKQDMDESGRCIEDTPNKEDLHKRDLPMKKEKELMRYSARAYFGLRRAKRAVIEKGFRDERLQWPGPCDNDDECPEDLWCLEGDCWSLPDKPIRMDQLITKQKDDVPASFPIHGGDQQRLEEDLWKELLADEEREKREEEGKAASTPSPSSPRPPASPTKPRSSASRSRFFLGGAEEILSTSSPPSTTAGPPGFLPSSAELIQVEAERMHGREEPEMGETPSSPPRSHGVKQISVDLLSSRTIVPFPPSLFFPVNHTKTIDLPEEKEGRVKRLRNEARRHRKKTLSKKLRRQAHRFVSDNRRVLGGEGYPPIRTLHRVEFPISSRAEEKEDETSSRSPSPLGEEETEEGFLRQFEEQRKRVQRERKRTRASGQEVGRERDDGGRILEVTTPERPSEDLNKASTPFIHREEFRPRKPSVPTLPPSRARGAETFVLPFTSSPLGRILSHQEIASHVSSRPIKEKLQTRTVDQLLKEEIDKFNQEQDRREERRKGTTGRSTISPSTSTALPLEINEGGGEFAEAAWKNMNEESQKGPAEFRARDTSPLSTRLLYEYTPDNIRRMPVRVEMEKAVAMVDDECRRDGDCGSRMRCCKKKWCDRSGGCGHAQFCLPSCLTTKMTHLGRGNTRETLIDIIYD